MRTETYKVRLPYGAKVTTKSNHYNADGDEDNDVGVSDTIDPADDDLSGFTAEELPKVRQLIREKKTALKAQYGRGRLILGFTKPNKTFSSPNWGVPKGAWIPYIPPKRVRGWRYQWHLLKKSGYKAQLKQMAQGSIPLVNQTTGETPTWNESTPNNNNVQNNNIPNNNVPETLNEKALETTSTWKNPITYVIIGGSLVALVGIVLIGKKMLK